MKITLRRSVGITGVALSVLGLVLCLAGAAGVWAAKKRVDGVATAVFTAADDAFEFMATRLVLVNERLGSSRQQIAGLSARAQRLQTMEMETEVPAEVESLRGTLDNVASELQAAEGWLDSIEAVARGVQSAAASIARSRAESASTSASTPATSESTVSAAVDVRGVRAAKVAEFADDLADSVNRLDALRARLLEMRENRMLAREFARAVIAEAADLDTRLANLSRKINDFSVRVSETRQSSADSGRRIHGWIALAAVLSVLVLLWFGVSQVCTMTWAWRRVRAPT